MIDTIVLTLNKDMYHISDPDKFEPSAQWVNNVVHGLHGIQSKQNPLKSELRRGIYKPRLTVTACIQPHGGIAPMRELRNMLVNYNKRSWYRLMADVKKVKLPATIPFLDYSEASCKIWTVEVRNVSKNIINFCLFSCWARNI